MTAKRAFISYAHEDEAFRKELEQHLSGLKRRSLLDVWKDRDLAAGAELDGAISENLEAADLIVMLISPAFVASNYCYEREMIRALEHHEAGKAHAVSIVCRPCDFSGLPFARFVMLPTDAKPVSTWPNRDEAWLDVARGIRKLLEGEPRAAVAAESAAPRPSRSPSRHSAPAGGLNLRRKPTDLDRREHLERGFEIVWERFNAWAHDLQQEEGVVAKIRRLDAEGFALRLYVGGDEVGGALVYLGSSSGQSICINFDPNDGRNTMNGWYSIAEHEGALGFDGQVGAMMMRHGGKEGFLDAEGVARSIWEGVMETVQARIR